MPPTATAYLVDNGSLAPAATLSLRRIAAALSARVGGQIVPVSLLHSDKVPASELGGTPAETLEAALRRRLEEGESQHRVLPLFFGPSGALTDYLPRRLARLRERFPSFTVRLAPWLDDPADPRLGLLLAGQVRAILATSQDPGGPGAAVAAGGRTAPDTSGVASACVILVDHGSPVQAVTAIRDRLAAELRAHLGESVRTVIPASMERRAEAAYAFNEPLLERALDEAAARGLCDVVLAQLFLSPGRHAGPGGDIATICEKACARHAALRIRRTPLVGEHPGLIDILADRLAAVA